MTTVAVIMPQDELQCKSSSDDSVSPSGVEFLSENNSSTDIVSSEKNEARVVSSEIKEECQNPESNSKIKRNSDQNMPDSTSEHQGPKRKNKNRKKRKWKPYYKLTWAERKELEERDARRANRIREEMTASGFALAPYNTTQFLMEDHNVQEPDYERICSGHRHRDNSNSSSDDFYSSPEDEEEFLHQQFVQTYEDIHNERLMNMTKTELVEELVFVEDKVEALEKILAEIRAQDITEPRPVRQSTHKNIESELEKIRVFREEIDKLKKENDALERENERLRIRLLEKKT